MNSPLQARILEVLSWGGPKNLDEIAEELHVPASSVRSQAAELGERGEIEGTPEGNVRLTS